MSQINNSSKASDWLAHSHMASWWLSWDDLQGPTRELEKKWIKRAKRFSAKGVDTVVVFGFHFRWDYVPILDRTLFVMGRIRDICHDNGMRIIDHHSAVLVHRPHNNDERQNIRDRHRHLTPFFPDNLKDLFFEGSLMSDWHTIDLRTGQPAFFDGYTCNQFCPNNPEFQKAYLRLIERTLDIMRPDGIMSDDVCFLPDEYVCACKYCQEKFRRETGFTLPPVTNLEFWQNRENPEFQAWLECRYRWVAEHHKRLREYMPKKIPLWGCISDCVTIFSSRTGQSVYQNAQYWDMVFHEIFRKLRLPTNRVRIESEIAAFASIARKMNKPLLTIFYAKNLSDLDAWFKLLAEFDSRPWLSKHSRDANSMIEEELLQNGFSAYEKALSSDIRKKPVMPVKFSISKRDRLPIEEAERYIQKYRQQCQKFIKQGYQIDVIFENQKN